MRPCPIASVRSALFVPASRLERVAKAVAAGADAVVIDLEDAVGPEDKETARESLARFMSTPRPGHLMVRLNPLQAPAGPQDLARVQALTAEASAVMLPKVQSVSEIEIHAAHLAPDLRIVALIETVRGVKHADAIAAHPAVAALAFGGADFSVELGAELLWEPMLLARATLVAAAASAGKACWDVPALAIGDTEALATETARVRDLGFTAKMAIHPSQVPTINAAFTPEPDALHRAERILTAFRRAGGGAVSLDGKMIDLPVVRTAERILARAASHTKDPS